MHFFKILNHYKMKVVNFQTRCKPKEYNLVVKPTDTVKEGILWWGGKPAQYIWYTLGKFKKIPTLQQAQKLGGVARSYDSFRPNIYKLSKSKVYKCVFVFDSHDVLKFIMVNTKIDFQNKTTKKKNTSLVFYYCPLEKVY